MWVLAKLRHLLLECLVGVESMDHLGKAETLVGDHMIQVCADSVGSIGWWRRWSW